MYRRVIPSLPSRFVSFSPICMNGHELADTSWCSEATSSRFVRSVSKATQSETAAMITAPIASALSAQCRSSSDGKPFCDMKTPRGGKGTLQHPLALRDGVLQLPFARLSLPVELAEDLMLRRSRSLVGEVDVGREVSEVAAQLGLV